MSKEAELVHLKRCITCCQPVAEEDRVIDVDGWAHHKECPVQEE